MTSIDKINALLLQSGKTGAELSRDIGLSNSAYSLWNTGSTKPSAKTLKKIADYFGVPVIDLLDDEKKEKFDTPKENNFVELSNQEKELLFAFRMLNNSGKDLLVQTARAFVHSGIYKEDTHFVDVS